MSENSQIAVLTSKSLPDLVCSELERWIISGKVSPGDPLREAEISAELGLSRGPVREAFRILAERGLVRAEKNRGVRVEDLTFEQVQKIYEVRIALEGLIGRLAAERIETPGMHILRGTIEEMTAAVEEKDVRRYSRLNFRLHEELAECAKNSVLKETYLRLVARLELFRSYSLRHEEGRAALSCREHRAIVEAVCSKDALAAERLLAAHTKESFARIAALMDG